ncbi:YheC/YheD family protein [Robertmurraya massiliosenegalensis]|uniref:YheC/YheD family endospore coat-associated protein n=1 Tax=Robertmurraya TaxID=2837507 RepID=UPI0039A441EF
MPTTLGIMTLNLQNEQGYFTEMAKRAKKFNIDCFRFIPSNINPQSEMIQGEEFDSNQEVWKKKLFPLPTILYDRCFYGDDFHSKQCKAIVDWLKTKKSVQFLGYGLPNKLKLYDVLTRSSLSPYLPKTVKVTSPEMVHRLLQTMKEIILKPISGSQGNGIYYIEKTEKFWIVRTDKTEFQASRSFSDSSQLIHWLERLLLKKEFILQPYLPLINEFNQPFDIRSLLQKDEHGEWLTVGKGIRIGKVNGIISNLSAGASVVDFDSWLGSIPIQKRAFIKEEIEDILKNLPLILEQHFPPLFELGVDIGMAEDYSLWILDVNSKPGRKVLLQSLPESSAYLYESPLLYANTIMKRSKSSHEKTLSD